MASISPPISFLIIGAQKAGTTSLFEYLRLHPDIHMPAEKEISFFSRNYARGSEWYIDAVLSGAPSTAICGEASIGYMGGTPYADITLNEQGWQPPPDAADSALETIIPRRIKSLLPDVRLICLLRDPVARAYSHYQMAVLDHMESRPFPQAVEELLTSTALLQARVSPTSTNSYIVNGEYYRILAGFLQIFPQKQILILLSDSLETAPAQTLAQVFGFIGANTNFVPGNLGARYRTAATRRRVPFLDLYAWQRALARGRVMRAAWHNLPDPVRMFIDRFYRRASFRITMWNALRGRATQTMLPETRTRLVNHFRPDSEALVRLGLNVPWLRDWGHAD